MMRKITRSEKACLKFVNRLKDRKFPRLPDVEILTLSKRLSSGGGSYFASNMEITLSFKDWKDYREYVGRLKTFYRKSLQNIILHELVHHKLHCENKSWGHTKEFRRVAKRLGVKDSSTYQWGYKCKCGYRFYHYKRVEGGRYCSGCGAHLTRAYKRF